MEDKGMKLDHVGIINKNEEEAVRFYCDLLGLEKVRESAVSAELAEQLFSYAGEIKMLVFEKGNVKVEVFVISGCHTLLPCISHFCLQVRDLPEFLERVKKADGKVISGEHRGKTVYFVEDFSGNRIEIKPV